MDSFKLGTKALDKLPSIGESFGLPGDSYGYDTITAIRLSDAGTYEVQGKNTKLWWTLRLARVNDILLWEAVRICPEEDRT